MMAPSDPASPIAPDGASIETFTRVVFGKCEGWVAVREFPEKGNPDQPPRTPFFPADANLAQNIAREAERAVSSGRALYVVPGTVSGQGKAKAVDVVAMQTVLVDLDHGDVRSKRDHLTEHLGPPSLEVISGGTTEDGQERLHLYWNLTEPALGTEVATICKLRSVIASQGRRRPIVRHPRINPSASQGPSIGRAASSGLVTIDAERPLEYELEELAAKVEALPALVPEAVSAETARVVAGKETTAKLFAKRIHENGIDGTTRFEALSSIIGYWIRRCNAGHVSRERAWEEIASYNEACIVPPWPVDRLREETERLWRRDREQSPQHDATGFSEDAVALQFTQRHGADWRYVAAWGQWFVWTGTHWQREETLRVYDLARIVCRDAAASCENLKLRAKIASASTVAAVERLARADRTHAASADIWDADLWSLNTPGGVVALKTGILVPHRRQDANTKIATATPRGECPAWQDFLATVTGRDAELQAYLQRVVGYCLTGVTGEHALFFLYGTGANGKSVFVTIVSGILGDYATVAPMDMFMAATGERHPTDMAGLRGARLVTATETEQGRRWAESKLKTLTGGDKITARFMRQDFFEFVPQFKLVVAGNHKPAIRNIDEAMRRRLHLIPFTVTIPPAERDKKLPEKLMAERDGIMAWAVDGCREWQQIGLKPPAAVSAATERVFRGGGRNRPLARRSPACWERTWWKKARCCSRPGRRGPRRTANTSAPTRTFPRSSRAAASSIIATTAGAAFVAWRSGRAAAVAPRWICSRWTPG